jgi:CRP-like cAMP-binding protein
MATPTADVLGKVPMFSNLSARQLRKLAQSSSEDHYDAGVTIVREGGRSDNFFVVVEGSASVVHDGQEVSRRGPGEFFGEISMLDGRPRAASVVAETPMTCIVVYRDALRSLVMNDPKVAWELLLSFAARMRGE